MCLIFPSSVWPVCLRKVLPASGVHVCFPGPKILTYLVGGLLILKGECGWHRRLWLLDVSPVLAFLYFTLSESLVENSSISCSFNTESLLGDPVCH